MHSTLLVVLQFALIAAVAMPLPGAVFDPRALALVAAGIGIGLWALATNRPGNFNIRPEPKAGGRLVTSGPYRFVRHPMYLAVLVAAIGCCLGYGTAWRWLALAGLAVVLHVKAAVEEAALARTHKGYRDYVRRSKRIVPFLY